MDLAKFVQEMQRVIDMWPDHAQWTVGQIASYAGSDVADTAVWLGYGLEQSVDTTTPLSVEQGQAAFARLQTAQETGVHIRPVEEVGSQDVINQLGKIQAKQRELAQAKDWRRAYKNWVQFLGQHAGDLPFAERMEALGDCLRVGIKGQETPQDLIVWLKRGVQEAISDGTQQGTEDALDFIDAYGDPFVADGTAPALEPLFQQLADLVSNHNLGDRVAEIRSDLEINS